MRFWGEVITMLCQVCNQRPANVHVTKVINNVRTELHLCQQCARERGELEVFAGPKFAFSNLLAGLLQSDAATGVPVGIPGGSRSVCSTCGLEYPEFMNTGYLGCSECYSQFLPMLRPLIARIHGHARHTGKVPARAGKAVRFRKELESLREELRTMIEAEEYEKAALVRDRIRDLEKAAEQAEQARQAEAERVEAERAEAERAEAGQGGSEQGNAEHNGAKEDEREGR